LNVDQLLAASDVLGWMSDRLSDLPENKEEGVVASLQCLLGRTIILQLAKHLQDGVEPYEALRRTAIGDLPLTQRQKDLWNTLRPPTVGFPAHSAS
jgi:hypothetical protein